MTGNLHQLTQILLRHHKYLSVPAKKLGVQLVWISEHKYTVHVAVWWRERIKEGGFQLSVPWTTDKTQPKKHMWSFGQGKYPALYTGNHKHMIKKIQINQSIN